MMDDDRETDDYDSPWKGLIEGYFVNLPSGCSCVVFPPWNRTEFNARPLFLNLKLKT